MASGFSVIIPAHNEAKVIRRCLEGLLAGAPAGAEPEIVVVCNGCSDETAGIARQVSPAIRVIETAQGSKPLALNLGNAAATALPRFFVDADVTVTYQALGAVANVLREGQAMAAAPRIRVDTTRSDPLVKAYYRTWLTQPYIADNMVGSGIYGLSAEGLARVGTFPSIIADDAFVRTRFSSEERRSVARDSSGQDVAFTVFPPRGVLDLIKIEGRRRAGDAELRALHPPLFGPRATSGGSLAGASVSPLDKAIYLAIKTLGRLRFHVDRMRGAHKSWHRDESSRVG